MSVGDYEILAYGPEHRDQVIALQQNLWSPERAVNEAYLLWKYEENPFIGSRFRYVAVHGSQVVAFIGFYGGEWEIGSPNRIAPGLCMADLVVHPAHRKRGVAALVMKSALNDLVRTEFEFTFSLSAGAGGFRVCMATHWRCVHRVETLMRRPGAHPIDPPARRVRMVSLPRVEAMADLFRRLPKDARMQQRQDPRYFAWRYRNPLSRYQFFFLGDESLEGFLVLQESIYWDFGKRVIADWQGSSENARRQLLDAALDWAGQHSISIWSSTLDPVDQRLLAERGFEDLRYETDPAEEYRPTLLVRPLDHPERDESYGLDGHDLQDVSNWRFRMIDSDGY